MGITRAGVTVDTSRKKSASGMPATTGKVTNPKKPPPPGSSKSNENTGACQTCQAEINDGATGVQCEDCLVWVHSDCLGLPAGMFDYIYNTGTSEDDPQTNTPPGPITYSAAAAKNITTVPGKIIHDLRVLDDTEKMRRCIVVSGLPENGSDFDDARKLVHSLDRSAEFREIFRMGPPKDPNGTDDKRPRLLKLVFSSAGVVRSVLSQAKILRGSVDFPDVFIRRSMSKEERDKEYQMRQDRNALNTNEQRANMRYAISRGEIVRFKDCRVDNLGNLVGGTLDKSWPEGRWENE